MSGSAGSPSRPRARSATAAPGTIEGLLSQEGEYFFLEMNTRIQVEHTVTEMATGLDLIREQVLIAAGEPLSLRQEDVRLTGHALECRINAEDPSNGFLPSPGRITSYREPGGPGRARRLRRRRRLADARPLRPAVAKLIVHGVDREHARRRMLRALGEYEIGGITTLLGFHQALLEHPCFVEGATCHGVVESEELAERAQELSQRQATAPAALDGAATRGRHLTSSWTAAATRSRRSCPSRRTPSSRAGAASVWRAAGTPAPKDAVVTPMQGTVLAVEVAEGDEVVAGQVICIVEAMKMENEITAHRAGVVTELAVEPGQAVGNGQVVCVVVDAS